MVMTRDAHLRHVLRALHYDFTAFALSDFTTHIEYFCDTQILLLRFPFAPDLHGVWIPIENVQYVFVNTALHPVHQIHIALHELAHIVLAHPPLPLSAVLPRALLEVLNVSAAAGRARFAGQAYDPQRAAVEQEAERFVFLVQQRVTRAQRLHELIGAGSSIEELMPLMRTVRV